MKDHLPSPAPCSDLLITPKAKPLTWRNRQLSKVNFPSCLVCSDGILILLQGKDRRDLWWVAVCRLHAGGDQERKAESSPRREDCPWQQEFQRQTDRNTETQRPGLAVGTGRYRTASLGERLTQAGTVWPWAHLGNALVHPGLALITTAPGLDACLLVPGQPLLQDIQHCLWLSRGHLKGGRRWHQLCLPLPRSPLHSPTIPSYLGLLGWKGPSLAALGPLLGVRLRVLWEPYKPVGGASSLKAPEQRCR